MRGATNAGSFRRSKTLILWRRWSPCWIFTNDPMIPTAKKILLVMDNLNTHQPGSLDQAFPPGEAQRLWGRFEFVHTPRHGSWLNMTEIEVNVLSRQSLNRRLDDMAPVTAEINGWKARRDNRQARVQWHFSTDDARIKLGGYIRTMDA